MEAKRRDDVGAGIHVDGLVDGFEGLAECVGLRAFGEAVADDCDAGDGSGLAGK